MNDNFRKLRDLLTELFQLDAADLDFGIYRIMNQKRDEIVRFLDRDLLPQVRETLQASRDTDVDAVNAELRKLEETLIAAGVDPSTSPKVRELRAQMSQADITGLENEVFSHLTNFFRRYYDEGDFISLRRYKPGVYAIPYEGEEVKLHWANADQYYIKTSEYFRDYTFTLPSGKRAHFRLAEADTERDNNQEQNGKERRFILCAESPLAEENGELIIRFEYRTDDTKRKQSDLNASAAQAIMTIPEFAVWQRELATPTPTDSNPRRTLLEKHLAGYTTRNTFDYFIHKDLDGFLRRELDFFIKNEVVRLDDIEEESAPRVEQYLAKVKVLRRIGHKIIAFLAQLEDFQKRLWLKKKFVVETNYCVTLDRVPEDLYPEIIANAEQIAEWKRLFAIEDIPCSLENTGYIDPLNVDFLKANPYLVLDTRFYNKKFTDRLLAFFDDLDEAIDGILIHSENFQALSLMQVRYWEQVKCIYIDPPYNSPASRILYKNDYLHSSWCTLMYNRLAVSRNMLTPTGVLQVAIDDIEFHRLEFLIRDVFGPEQHLANIAIMHNPKGRDQGHIATAHEYTIIAARNAKQAITYRLHLEDEEIAKKFPKTDGDERCRELPLRRSGSGASRNDRPYMYFPFLFDEQNGVLTVVSSDEYDRIFDGSQFNDAFVESLRSRYVAKRFVFILPIRDDGSKGRWRWGYDTCKEGCESGVLFARISPNPTVYQRDAADAMFLPKSIWFGERYDASTKGTNLLKDIVGNNVFDYPKSLFAVIDMISIGSGNSDSVLDYFAGSGTTGHAVINLNREDGGTRKYILVEMGEHFDTVLKPRIMKVIYSKDWKDGKPVSREGSSHLFKYLRLESYEDTLNNLALCRTPEQDRLLDVHPQVREVYLLQYVLDVESRGSASLLNIDAFEDPFNYKLNISTGSVGETKAANVDLVETFNYLLGLRVKHLDAIRGFRVVQGSNPRGEKVLVIWRNVKEKSSADLDDFFLKQGYNTRDLEFNLIYVNGDNNLENLRRDDETWKVRLIDEEFQRLMFDVHDV